MHEETSPTDLCEHGFEQGWCFPCKHSTGPTFRKWVKISDPFLSPWSSGLCTLCKESTVGRMVVNQRQVAKDPIAKYATRYVHMDCAEKASEDE